MKTTVVFHDHVKTSINRICSEQLVPKTVIELGVFEGDTTFNLAHLLSQHHPDYKHYAVDPFTASENLTQPRLDEAKALFLENLAQYPQVELITKDSVAGLIELYSRGVKADLIYVDGSHFAKDVLVDSALGFELLNIGGVMLFDDAVSWRYGEQIQDSPKIAVDAFIHCNWDRLEVLEMPNGYQVAVKRIK